MWLSQHKRWQPTGSRKLHDRLPELGLLQLFSSRHGAPLIWIIWLSSRAGRQPCCGKPGLHAFGKRCPAALSAACT